MAFQKGVSGNPSGRPKISKEFRDLARDKSPKCLEEVLRIAKEGKRDSDRIKACELVMAYGYGKPNQAIELTGSVNMPDELIDAPPRLSRSEWLKEYQVTLADEPLN